MRHVGWASTPAAGLQTRLVSNNFGWVFDCAIAVAAAVS